MRYQPAVFNPKYENNPAFVNCFKRSFENLSQSLEVSRQEHRIEEGSEFYDQTLYELRGPCSRIGIEDTSIVMDAFMDNGNNEIETLINNKFDKLESNHFLPQLQKILNNFYSSDNGFISKLNEKLFKQRISDHKNTYDYYFRVTTIEYPEDSIVYVKSSNQLDSKVVVEFETYLLDKRTGLSKMCQSKGLSSLPIIEEKLLKELDLTMDRLLYREMMFILNSAHYALQEDYYNNNVVRFLSDFQFALTPDNDSPISDILIPFNLNESGTYCLKKAASSTKFLHSKYSDTVWATGKAMYTAGQTTFELFTKGKEVEFTKLYEDLKTLVEQTQTAAKTFKLQRLTTRSKFTPDSKPLIKDTSHLTMGGSEQYRKFKVMIENKGKQVLEVKVNPPKPKVTDKSKPVLRKK